MGRDKFPDNLFPCVDHFSLAQPLAQSELLHQFGQKIGWRLPPVRPRFFFRQPAPLGDNGGTQRRVHERTGQYFRRMLLGRMFSSVRYFATVRRAIGMPRSLRISTISLSLSGEAPFSFFTSSRIASFTLVLLIDSPVAVW